MKRRRFLKMFGILAADVALSGCAATKPLAEKAMPDADNVYSDATGDYWQNWHSVPKEFPEVFWGYHSAKVNPEHLLHDVEICAATIKTSLAKLNLREHWRASANPTQDAADNNVQLKNEALTGKELEIAINVEQRLETAVRSLQAVPYEERFAAVIETLRESLRDVPYKLHTDWTGAPQALPSLLTDTAAGDCKDFAFARAQMAQKLGVRPEHMMVVLFGSRKPEGTGHVMLWLYDPKEKVWVTVDGTGRGPEDKLGQVLLMENDGGLFQGVKAVGLYPQHLVPLMAVNAQGAFGFDSIKGIDPETHKPIYNDPAPMPQRKGAYFHLTPSEPMQAIPAPAAPSRRSGSRRAGPAPD